MSEKVSRAMWAAIFSLAFVGVAHAQHNFNRTITVDPSGRADHTTIQGAINSIQDPSSGKYTILIFSETYNENITLNELDENIDLVGIDRDAVIIAPSSGDGIVITSGTETSRNNSIRNLTINTTTGHGIKIVKGGTPVPKNIVIEGVTIEAAGTDNDGILGTDADGVRIFDCNITSADGIGINVGNNFEIINSVVTSDGTTQTRPGLMVHGKIGLRVSNCKIEGGFRGLEIRGGVAGVPVSRNIEIVASEIRGASEGMYFYNFPVADEPDVVRFRGCYLVADGNIAGSHVYPVYLDGGSADSDVVFQGCRIEALGGSVPVAVAAVQIDNTENTRFVDCDFRAVSENTTAAARVEGIRCREANVTVIGGSIETSQAGFDKAIDVFDLVGNAASADHIFVSGTEFSKWIGLINAAGRQRSVTQRLLNVVGKKPQRLVANGDLDGVAITVGTPQLATYRAIRVKWNNASGDDITVVAEGTNWAGDKIAEAFVLSTVTPEVQGNKPFNRVETIYIPDAPGNIDVGTTDKLGLYYPLSATTDVIQEALLVSNVYTTQSVGTPDDVYATIIPSSALTITPESFGWMLLTSP